MATSQLGTVVHSLCRAAILHASNGMTDGQLLEHFLAQQDEAAFELLVRRHGPMVWELCHRVLRHWQDAEDAFQATFLVLARKATTITQRESVANWLYGVAYRAALEGRAARRRLKESQVSAMPEPEAPVEAEVWDGVRSLLDKELARLPYKYREPVVLCDLEGKTRREVARLVGVPLGTLSGRLTTARRLLARRLARHGLALSSGALAMALNRGSAAGLPKSLVTATVRIAAGHAAAAGVVSIKVAVIAEGVVRAMCKTPLKRVLAVLAMLVSFTLGVGAALQKTDAQPGAGKRGDVAEAAWRAAGTLEGHDNAILCLAFGPAQVLVASDEGPRVRVWDVAARKELPFYRLEGATPKDRAVTGIAYAPDDSWVSFREKNAIHLAFGDYLEAGKPIDYGIGFGGGGLRPLAIAADGRTYAFWKESTNDVAVLDWDIKNQGQETGTARCKGHEGEPLCAAYSADGTWLVTGSEDKTARVWNTQSGDERQTLRGHTNGILVVAFSPSGKLVATGGKDGLVKLWDTATGKECASLRGHTVVRCLAFSPDGKALATGGEDQTLRVWDVSGGTERAALKGHEGAILALGFSRDGSLMASAGQDKTIRLWKR